MVGRIGGLVGERYNVTERRHRLVRLCVRIFPAAFRTRYADEIVEYWRRRSRQVREQRGRLGLVIFACRWAVDIVRTAMLERRDALRVVRRQRSKPRRLASLTQDFGYALRGIRRSPGLPLAGGRATCWSSCR